MVTIIEYLRSSSFLLITLLIFSLLTSDDYFLLNSNSGSSRNSGSSSRGNGLVDAADFASMKPTALYYNYVACKWLSSSTAVAVGYSATGGAIVRTTSAGWSWSSVGTSITYGGLYGLGGNTISGTTYLYAADDGGMVYASTDSGVTWTTLATTFSSSLFGVAVGSNGNIFISGTGGLISRSTVTTTSSWTTVSPTTTAIVYDVR